MKNVKIITYVIVAGLPLAVISAASKGYEPVGPAETALLEKALRNKMAGYNCAFWPRAEKLDKAILGKSLPKEYTDSIKKWLARVLQPDLVPKKLDPNDWLGVRKLYFNRNRIIGRFPVADVNGVVEFKARYRGLSITIHSDMLFLTPASDMTSDKVTEMMTKILKIPEEKISKINIKSHIEKLANVDVCYGKMFCEWTETSSPFESERQWWSYIPFWYMKGKMFVSITTVEPTDLPHATIKERWPFE